MYFYAEDTAAAAIVIIHRGVSSDADQQGYVDAITAMNERYGVNGTPIFILINDVDGQPPDAKWRKRIADVTRESSPHALVAFVSESPLMRGIVTAINWIRPSPYKFTVERDVEQAIIWIERARPQVRAVVERLYGQARKAADTKVVVRSNATRAALPPK